MIHFFVPGIPAPQGSKRYLKPGVMVESSKRVAPWRADVRAGATEAVLAADEYEEGIWDGPVTVLLDFTLPRPKSHYGTGRNSDRLKDSAPTFPAVTPDVDKLARAVCDALTGVVFADDKTVVSLLAAKKYGERPGVAVTVTEAL